jgi:hypothetical protein
VAGSGAPVDVPNAMTLTFSGTGYASLPFDLVRVNAGHVDHRQHRLERRPHDRRRRRPVRRRLLRRGSWTALNGNGYGRFTFDHLLGPA